MAGGELTVSGSAGPFAATAATGGRITIKGDAGEAAGGAIYAQRAGKISCIQRAAPRTSIVTVSAYDTAGPLEIDTAASRIDRINTIRPRFWSPAHRWQMTAMEEVTAASYQTEDGGKRTRGIDYPFVSDARQASQLAALQIAGALVVMHSGFGMVVPRDAPPTVGPEAVHAATKTDISFSPMALPLIAGPGRVRGGRAG